MGYETTVTGHLTFSPRLAFKAFSDSPWRAVNDTGRGPTHDVHLIEEAVTRDTDDGQATVITAVGVEAVWETAKHYRLESDLQALITSLPNSAMVAVTGYLEVTGAWPDARRLYVRRGQVVTVQPSIMWLLDDVDLPDETVETGRDSR